MLLYVIFALQIFIRASSTLWLNSKIGIDNDLERKYNPIFGQSSSTRSSFQNGIQFRDLIFVQKLDHSRPTDGSKWFQRYFVNDLYYEEGGPIFLFIFGEDEANSRWMGRGPQWTTYAKKFNALCFGLEHRSYGKSRPKANTNITNLQYLTTEQALADVAYFIESVNKNNDFPSDTKWILFGGSYAGSLAAWARMKYPHLVHGAVASSAPLLAKTDFFEYFQVVERSLRRHSPKCAKNVAIANRHLKQAIQTPSGRARVSRLFKLCSTLTNNTDDIATLFDTLATNIAVAVQYNGKFFSIRDVCKHMNDDETPRLQRYANVNAMFLNLIGQRCTSANYTEAVRYLQNETYQNSDQQSYRLWIYQTCTEYGFFQTSSKPKDLFGEHIPVAYYIKMCRDVFGPRFDKAFVDSAVNRTNIEFGGLTYNSSRVIFIHGDIDPWHALGITDNTKSDAYKVILIPGESHCNDMHPPSDNDSEHLKSARRKISEVLKSWLVEEDISSDDDDSDPAPRKIKFQMSGDDRNIAVRAKVEPNV